MVDFGRKKVRDSFVSFKLLFYFCKNSIPFTFLNTSTMNKMLYLMLVVGVLTACEKSEFDAKSIKKQQMDPLESYLTRVAEEGIALLGDAPTRSGGRRVVDPARIKAAVASSTRSGELDTLFYVVNFADSAGFALIDADTMSARPLFAVTEKGNYTPGEVTNTGFDDYVALIECDEASVTGLDLGDSKIRYNKLITGPVVEVEPLLEVKWGQLNPYNALCYADEYAAMPSKAGCVPIAMAQIMSYYEYPEVLPLTHPETSLTSINLNWEQIKYHEITDTSEIVGCMCSDHTGLQQLIREIGQRAGTIYEQGGFFGSGSTLPNAVESAFPSLGYSTSTLTSYSWNAVCDELRNARPVYARGSAGMDANGHAWVIDGYYYQYRYWNTYEQGENGHDALIKSEDVSYCYLHINWGSDGANNGLFQDGIFSTTQYVELDDPNNYNDVPYSYNYNTQILTNVKPIEL